MQLWEVLYRRIPGDLSDRGNYTLPEPHDYFGGHHCHNVYWKAGGDPKHGEMHEQNPVDIPDLMEFILVNLVAISVGDLKDTPETRIRDLASGSYHNLQDTDLNCDYTRDQSWWCEALTDGEMFPWLWDINANMVNEMHEFGSWNWELLARQLSQLNLHDPEDTTIKLPLALKNRRRIWRLLEEARVGDVAEAWEKEWERTRSEREEEARRAQGLSRKTFKENFPSGIPWFPDFVFRAPVPGQEITPQFLEGG